MVFNIDHTNAVAYADAVRNLLSGPAEQALLPAARDEYQGAVRGGQVRGSGTVLQARPGPARRVDMRQAASGI
ncbi:MAG: hypothetical protein ACRDPF_21315 [Streptosporangiaceae bacterium]